MRVLAALACAGLLVSACGGSSGSPSDNPSPSPPGTNPCSTAASAEEEEQAALPLEPDPARALKTHIPDGNSRWRVLDALWTHREAEARGGPRSLSGTESRLGRANAADVGDIAVVQDQGDIVAAANPYDLVNLGLRFTRNSLWRLRRPPVRRRFPRRPRHPADAHRRRQRRQHRAVRVLVLRQDADRRVRQLRRQHHVRARRTSEHRSQRRAAADGAAARRAVLRRSRSERRRRPGVSSTPRRIATPSPGATCAGSTPTQTDDRPGDAAARRQRSK